VLAAWWLVPALLAGQTAPGSGRFSELLTLVGRHAPGQNDDAVALLASWPRRELESVSNEFKRLLKTFNPASPAEARLTALDPFGVTSAESLYVLLERIAMLHTDVAIFRRNAGGYSLPVDRGMEHQISGDGRSLGVTTGTFHWEAARRVLDLVPPTATANAEVLLWYQTTTAVLQSWNDYYELAPHLIRARERFPRDAVLLLYDGTVHENFAEPRIQNTQPQPETALSGPCLRLPCTPTGSTPQMKSWFSSPAAEWRTAQTLFEQALKIDPNLSEARIRLARVLALQGQHDAAVMHLNEATGGPATLPPRLRYFALLLLGRSQWTLGRPGEAESAYLRAAELFPEAQSPRLGLSQVAHDRGDRTRALAYLSPLQKPPRDREDPWWKYNRTHVPDAIELTTTLVQRLSK
jgi:tetratricopeptide (TPR) repeat protein